MTLPDISRYAEVRRDDIRPATKLWDLTMRGYAGILYAEVIGEHEQMWSSMVEGDWRFLLSSQRYRNTQTQEVLREDDLVDLRDQFTDIVGDQVRVLVDRFVDGDSTLNQWVRSMARLGRDAHTAAYLLGSGGFNTITESDVLDLEETLRGTHGYLLNLANDVEVGGFTRDSYAFEDARNECGFETVRQDPTVPRVITARGLRNRGVMWIESVTRSYERARATTYGFHPDILPNYPADGTMECLVRCRCHWRFRFLRGQDSYYHAYWTLRGHRPDGRNCRTCIHYSEIYNPYTVVRF